MSYMMGNTPMGGYQQASVPQPQERYPQLNGILHTEDGFKRSVNFSGGADSALGGVFTVAVLLLVWNIISTVRTLTDNHLPFSYFFDVFRSTIGENGSFNSLLWVMVYVPLIAVPVIIVLFILKKATLNSSLSNLYDQFNRGGFVAELVPTSIMIAIGRQRCKMFVFGAPNVPPDWVTGAAQHMVAAATTDPKSKETKNYLKALNTAAMIGGVGALKAAQASKADPTIPAGIFLTSSGLRVDPTLRVAVPIGNDFTKLRLYTLKKGVPAA